MTIMGMTAVIMLFVFLLGASVFSFVNVLIYRVPKQLPFGNERSFCPQCGQALKGYDMIPVFSYLLLGGKCRYCKCRISPRYPLIETLGGILAVWSVYYFGQSEMYSGKSMGQAVLVFLLLALLTAVTFVDIDTLEIPNGFVLAVLVLAVGAVFLFPEVKLWERGVGILCVSVPLALITLAVPGAFGGGDMKLMAALGAFLGWKLTVVAFFLAVLTGGGYGIYLLATRKKGRKEHFAFGPFLCVGAMLSIFWGADLMRWYFGFLQ